MNEKCVICEDKNKIGDVEDLEVFDTYSCDLCPDCVKMITLMKIEKNLNKIGRHFGSK